MTLCQNKNGYRLSRKSKTLRSRKPNGQGRRITNLRKRKLNGMIKNVCVRRNKPIVSRGKPTRCRLPNASSSALRSPGNRHGAQPANSDAPILAGLSSSAKMPIKCSHFMGIFYNILLNFIFHAIFMQCILKDFIVFIIDSFVI